MDVEEYYYEERSCARAQLKCLCGSGACRLCCRGCPTVRESTSTRIVYVFFLLLSMIIMAIMMTKHVQSAALNLMPDKNSVCEYLGAGEHCESVLGYMAVYRLGLALSVYHLLLMLVTYGTTSSTGCRAGIHNGVWFYKVMLLLGLCFAVFIIPDPHEYFILVWMYTAMVGAALFLVIQLILLVFMVHNWSDIIVKKVNAGASACCYLGVLVPGITLLGFTLCVGGGFLLYFYFAWHKDCIRNQWFIYVNTGACLIVSLIAACKRGSSSLLMRLFQCSLVSAYVQYLTWTALNTAPRSFQSYVVKPAIKDNLWSKFGVSSSYEIVFCGHNREEQMWTDLVMPYVSAGVMFCAVIYASLATSQPENCRDLAYPNCPVSEEATYEDQDMQAIKVEDVGGQVIIRNEKREAAYSYSLFHLMMALATLFAMMSLTGWYQPDTASLRSFGRSWPAAWMTMVSSWVCLLVYLFTMLFPSIVPKRYRQHLRVTNTNLQRSTSRVSCASLHYSYGPGSKNGSVRSVGRGYFGSNGSLGVGERFRRYSSASQNSLSLDAVPLHPSEQPPTVVKHQETTV